MSVLVAKAPGKAMILGEYSVLNGYLAIVSAVDRFAYAYFYQAKTTSFWSKTFSKLIKQDDHPLFLSAIKACADQGFSLRPGRYELHTGEFFHEISGAKLGLGSSAAGITALCRLLVEQSKTIGDHELFKLAKTAHLDFSQALGSGADVAAASFGNSISFKKIAPDKYDIKKIDLSFLWSNLYCIDTKTPQNTREFIPKFIKFAQINPSYVAEFYKSSNSLCEQLIKPSITLKESQQIFAQANNLLYSLGKTSGLDIVSVDHQKIAKIARNFGGSAKPSGAGGGDIALALIEDSQRIFFEREIIKNGFDVLQLKPLNS